MAIHETGCAEEAQLIANSVRALLGTPEGQHQAADYVRHRLNDHGVDVPSEADESDLKVAEVYELSTGKFAMWGGGSYLGNFDTRHEAEAFARPYKEPA